MKSLSKSSTIFKLHYSVNLCSKLSDNSLNFLNKKIPPPLFNCDGCSLYLSNTSQENPCVVELISLFKTYFVTPILFIKNFEIYSSCFYRTTHRLQLKVIIILTFVLISTGRALDYSSPPITITYLPTEIWIYIDQHVETPVYIRHQILLLLPL